MEENVNINTEIMAEDFSKKTWKDDLTLTVEGKQIYVCKQVLGLVSPVFDAMFGGDFKEKNPEELELPGKKHVDFCEFLRCVYPNMLHHVTISNVLKVLPLADEYQVMRLKTECETCLLGSLSSDTSAEELYNLLLSASAEELYNLLLSAYLYDLDTLKGKATGLLVEKPQEDLDDVGAKVPLPPDVEMDLHKRMLRILKASTFQLVEKSKTLTALNGCLASNAQDNKIMSEYTRGKWIGDSAKFEVYLKGDLQEQIEIHLCKVKFTVKFSKRSYYNCFNLFLKSSSAVGYDVRLMGMIIIKNWMGGKADKVVDFTGRVRTNRQTFKHRSIRMVSWQTKQMDLFTMER